MRRRDGAGRCNALARGPRFPSGRGHRSVVVVNHLARRSRLHLLLQLVRGPGAGTYARRMRRGLRDLKPRSR